MRTLKIAATKHQIETSVTTGTKYAAMKDNNANTPNSFTNLFGHGRAINGYDDF